MWKECKMKVAGKGAQGSKKKTWGQFFFKASSDRQTNLRNQELV